jgi:hypothetical protein
LRKVKFLSKLNHWISAVTIISSLAISDAQAWVLAPYTGCPGSTIQNKKISWRHYLATANRGPGDFKVVALFSIHFDRANIVNDKAALPGIDPKACYVGSYNKGMPKSTDGYHIEPNWPAGSCEARDVSNDVPTPGHFPDWSRDRDRQSLGIGDPLKGQINVRGTMLTFRESGEVLNQKGQVVGKLVCYASNECGKYAYK